MKYTLLTLLSLVFLFTIIEFNILLAQQKGGELLDQKKPESSNNTYALVIGISNYQDEGIPDLQYADRDALAYAGFLQSKAGGALDKDHLRVLLNEEATAGNFGSALAWLVEVAKEGDNVIIYFSGHGDVESTTLNQPGFLLCWDAPSRVYVAGGTMGLFYFQGYISTLAITNKANVVVIADACRSGKLSGSAVGGSQITNANLLERYENESKILSCQPSEYSIEGDQWGGGRGAFSYHLVNGLYGLADRDSDKEVTLMEIRSYLEEKVSAEVAPYSQLPVTTGDSRAVLSSVDDETLAELKASKLGEVEMYSAIALRGIEEEILDSIDTEIKQFYDAFELALKEKRYLKPEEDCAEYYYNLLLNESVLEPLHSGLTRNYAAALQDDAQQALNLDLSTGLDKQITENMKLKEVYEDYPAYLQRAAELLGKEHYIYPALMARKHYFQSRLVKGDSLKKIELKKALSWQPDMPHAYRSMLWRFNPEPEDSVLYYAQKAMEMAPSWMRPYVSLYYYYMDDKQDDSTAFHWLKEGQKKDPNSASINYTIARYFDDQIELDSAVYYFKKTIENTSSDICFPCAHNSLGSTLVDLERYEEAEEHFLFALYDPRSNLNPALVLTNLGITNTGLKKYEKALDYFRQAEEIDSTLFETQWAIGRMYDELKDTILAESYYLKAFTKKKIQQDTQNLQAALAITYKDWGMFEKAIPYYEKALSKFANKSDILGGLALCYLETGKFEKAIPLYLEALEKDPDNTAFLNSLGSIYGATRQSAKAYPLVKHSFDLDSTGFVIYLKLAGQTSNMGNYKEALRLITKGLSLDTANQAEAIDICNAGIINRLNGNYEEAETYFLEAISRDSSYLGSYDALAGLYFLTEQVEKSIQIVDLMVKRGVNPLWAANRKGNIYRDSRQFGKAEQIYNDVLIQNPTAAWAYDQLGTLYKAQKKFELAEESYKSAISFNPDNPLFYRNLGRLFIHTGRYEEGLDMYHKLIEIQPENPNYYNSLGDLYFIMGRYEEAEENLQIGRQIGPSNWVIHITSAQVQQAQQNWEEALQLLEIAKQIRQDFPAGFIMNAISYTHLGQLEKANLSIEKAKTIGINGTEDKLKYTQFLAASDEIEEAWTQLEETLKGADGKVYIKTLLNNENDFDEMRKDSRWDDLMMKYFLE